MRVVAIWAVSLMLPAIGIAAAHEDADAPTPASNQASGLGAGAKVFRQCKSCHTIEPGGPNRHGPNLHGIVNRPVASVEGFRYSDALKEYGGKWTPDRLDAYLENPRKVVKGTKMAFPGIRDAEDRADLIAYLKSQGGSQAGDEPSASTAGDQENAAKQNGEDFGQLVVAEGVEETWYACTACHSEMIVAQQGKNREDWDETLDWMVEEQGMPELPPEDRETILDYLAEHYNTGRPNFPR